MLKLTAPKNRLIGDMPRVGIRPTIDGRLQGVRESLETTTMNMAKNVARLIESTLRHSNGLPVECVVADRCIGGNHDLGVTGEVSLDVFADLARDAIIWTRQALGEVGRAKLRDLEPADPDGAVPLYHGSPRDPVWEYVLTVEQAREALEHRRVPLTLVGHTHIPSLFSLEGRRLGVQALRGESGAIQLEPDGRYLINPGSIGQPRDRDPRASFITYDSETRTVRWQRVDYAISKAQERIIRSGLPKVLADRLALGI